MRHRAIIAVILLATATTALADDDGPIGYAGLRGSLAFQNSMRATAVSTSTPPVSTQARVNGNIGGGGSIFWGMHLPYGFSTELELLYRYVPLSNGSVSLSDGTTVGGALSGSGRLFAPMLNAYWDLPVGDLYGVQPFIGGGVGYAWNELALNQVGGGTDRSDAWHLDYNFMAGVSMPLDNGARLKAMYRWLREDGAVLCNGAVNCSGALTSQSVDLGVEFSL